jgi:hypothetical protein
MTSSVSSLNELPVLVALHAREVAHEHLLGLGRQVGLDVRFRPARQEAEQAMSDEEIDSPSQDVRIDKIAQHQRTLVGGLHLQRRCTNKENIG